jgi:superfamily II DNA/RNA helicase
VHGDLGQGAREQALRAFRSGKVDVLVATDVAARGIDVDDVTHVVNYQCPEDAKTYVHRIGRTGRAGKTGVAVTLVDWDELHRWKTISDDLGLGMPEPAETYSTSPHLFTDLSIPDGAKGRLPHSQRTRAGLEAEYVDSEGDVGGRKRDRGRSRPEEEPALPEKRPRRSRSRTRSRSGVVVEGEGAADGAPAAPNGAAPTAAAPAGAEPAAAPQPTAQVPATGTATAEPAGSAGPDGEGGADRPRRRRRRGGRGRGSAERTTDAPASPEPADAAAS